MEFGNPVFGDQALVRAQIRSPDFESGVSGWILRRDGTAEFAEVLVRGEVFIGDADGQFLVLTIDEDGVGGYPGPSPLFVIQSGDGQFIRAFSSTDIVQMDFFSTSGSIISIQADDSASGIGFTPPDDTVSPVTWTQGTIGSSFVQSGNRQPYISIISPGAPGFDQSRVNMFGARNGAGTQMDLQAQLVTTSETLSVQGDLYVAGVTYPQGSPGVFVRHSGVQASPGTTTGEATVLAFNLEDLDVPGTMWSLSPNPTRIVIPRTGLYSVSAGYRVAGTSLTIHKYWIQILRNGNASPIMGDSFSQSSGTAVGFIQLSVSQDYFLTEGDYLELASYRRVSAADSVNVDQVSMSVQWSRG